MNNEVGARRPRRIHLAKSQRKLDDARPGDLVITLGGLHRVGRNGHLWAFTGGAA